jgi:hypothetical protein
LNSHREVRVAFLLFAETLSMPDSQSSFSCRLRRLSYLVAFQCLLATAFVGSALAEGPPRLGVIIDVDKSASTVDCAGEILAQVRSTLVEDKRVVVVDAGESEAGWQELATANELALVTVISVEKSTVKFGGQLSVGRSTSNVYKAATSLRVRVMDVASQAAVMDEEVQGRASVKEPQTGIPLVNGIIAAVEAGNSAGDGDKKLKQTDEYAQKYETTLLESVEKATGKLRKLFLRALPIRGQLTAVAAKSVTVDVGGDWGIGKKNKFLAYRPAADGGEEVELGVLSVQSVKGNTTVLKGSKKVLAELAVGDLIRSK